MLSFPDHVAIRLVAEHGDVLATHQIGDAPQVFFRRDAAGRVVRRVQEDGLRSRFELDEALDLTEVRAEMRSPGEVGDTRASYHGAQDVRLVSREGRLEDEDRVVGFEEQLAEEQQGGFAPGSDYVDSRPQPGCTELR